MTNLAFKKREIISPDWEYFVSEIQKIYNLTEKDIEHIYNSSAARIITAIPYEANCYRPEITAIVHLSLYVNELKGFQKYCACSPLDDNNVYERLEPISHFRSENKKIIQYGMDTLAYIMIENYHLSEKYDIENGNYNPFVSGSWNYRILKKQFERKINFADNPFITALPSIPGIVVW